MRKIKWLALAMILSLVILGGCAKKVDISQFEIQLAEKSATIEELVMGNKDLIAEKVALEEQVEQLKQELSQAEPIPGTPAQLQGPSPNLLATSMEVIGLLKDQDMTNLSDYVHATNGLRFSPYFYIDMQNDQSFTALEVATLDQNATSFNWGEYDGVGDPINLIFTDYYNQFIYDEDFIKPHLIGNNTSIGSGNMIDNIAQTYPNSHFVEYHFTQFDPQYDGMDWRSLRLVFEQEGGLWYLVGIVHGQWTV